jgi:hypothetical protein
MTVKKAKESSMLVEIPGIQLKTIRVKVVGVTPLIMHSWSEKAKKEMLGVQTQEVKKPKEKRNPVRDFIESMYWKTEMPTEFTIEDFEEAINNGAKFQFPSIAFKLAAASASYRAKMSKDKVSILGAFYIEGEFVEIHGTPNIREDMVRLQGTSADLRYRGEFKEWSAELTITYMVNVISAEQIINLLNYGGFSCGIGEWRPEKSGQFGMYRIEGL